jgi:hypothetical protein
MQLQSSLTCPSCRHVSVEIMPTDASVQIGRMLAQNMLVEVESAGFVARERYSAILEKAVFCDRRAALRDTAETITLPVLRA